MMSSHDNIKLETEEELVTVQIEEPTSTKTKRVYLWCRRIFDFNDEPNQKHYRPMFIIVMCILHISIHLCKYIDRIWDGKDVEYTLYHFGMFFVPCMRPAPYDIRTRIVSCGSSTRNVTCLYDDELKKMCYSFMYPYQMWRIITVNLIHLNRLHLLANILYQGIYGILLERKYGSIRVFVVYWLSDFGASLSFMLVDAEKPGIGASGALYGLLLFLIVDRLISIQRNPGCRLIILVQSIIMISLPFLITQPLIILAKFQVAHSAHVGGALVGFLCAVCMLGCPWPWCSERCICQTICQRIAFIFLFLYFVTTMTIFLLTDAPTIDPLLYKR